MGERAGFSLRFLNSYFVYSFRSGGFRAEIKLDWNSVDAHETGSFFYSGRRLCDGKALQYHEGLIYDETEKHIHSLPNGKREPPCGHQ